MVVVWSGGMMWDALIAAIVTAVVSRAGEDIGNAAQFTWTTMFRALRRRLGPKETLIDTGDGVALEQALQDLVLEDPEFAARMQALLLQDQVRLGEKVPIELTVPSPALPARSAARQLPAGPVDFINRVAELSKLDEVGGPGEAGAVPVIVLRGAPGSGKTALALRWGHWRQERFGGGQLYADMRELPNPGLGGPESADEVLTSFLLAMGVPGNLQPDNFAARRSLYRTLTADRPVLVLLRGAALPAQVSQLIPTAPGSVMLVSTQHDVRGLAMEGARFVDVDPLDDAAALALLAAICGRERIEADPPAAKRLITLCGHLPIALRIVAGRLQLDSTMTVAELAQEVSSEPYLFDALALPGGSSSVEPLFNNAYRHLKADAQRLYRDLGAIPVAEVSDDLLAYVGWSDRVARRSAVEELLGLTLLQRVGRDRYTLHSLIRAHASRLAQQTGPGHAERVVTDSIEYFCEFTESADRAVMRDRRRLTAGSVERDNRFAGPNPRAGALRALERSREDLLRIARVALAVGADGQVMRLATAAQALYFNHQHLADQTEMSRLAITAAKRLGRGNVEVQIRCTLAKAYADVGEFDRARTEIAGAFALLPSANDPILAGTVWEFNGRVLDLVSRAVPAAEQAAVRDQAEAALLKAVGIFADHEVDRGVALGQLYLGIFLDAAGRPAQALTHLIQARDGLNAVDDDRNATLADAALGAAHLHLGQNRQAYDELAAAAAYFAVAELWQYELEVREDLVLAATALGDQALATEHAERASEIRDLSNPGQ
jgi:tetratricopeptide (TPR) repeat protein